MKDNYNYNGGYKPGHTGPCDEFKEILHYDPQGVLWVYCATCWGRTLREHPNWEAQSDWTVIDEPKFTVDEMLENVELTRPPGPDPGEKEK